VKGYRGRPLTGLSARRRYELSKLYGGSKVDPEKVPAIARAKIKPIEPKEIDELPPAPPETPGWPFDAIEARRRQKARGAFERTVDLGGGVTMTLARIPAGEFVMGDATGQLDERPQVRRKIARDFWMGVFEVTNEQFRRFDAKHNSGRFAKRFVGADGPGLPLDGAKLPAVRISWKQADEFCKWLSKETSLAFSLPAEAQWEYACRAGSAEAFSYGAIDADFSGYANLADKALGDRPNATGGLQSNITSVSSKGIKGILLSAVYGGNIICDPNFDDKAVATSPVGRYKPNAWGLFDMHGNAAEWTRTTYRPYSAKAVDRKDPASERKVLRGGSWVDRPKRCRSGFRLAYPTWQRVHNAGFRVVCKVER